MLAAAPSLTHPAGRNFIGLKIEKAFSSAHRSAQTQWRCGGHILGCRSFWVLTESQGQPCLPWAPAESVLVGPEAVPASPCLHLVRQVRVCSLPVCWDWVWQRQGTSLLPQSSLQSGECRATTLPFHLRMLLFEAAGPQDTGTGLSYVCKKLQWDSWAAITDWAHALDWRLMHHSWFSLPIFPWGQTQWHHLAVSWLSWHSRAKFSPSESTSQLPTTNYKSSLG